MLLRRLFLDHPASVDETYGEHFRAAIGYSGRLAAASLGAALHALVPGLCCTTASDRIHELESELQARRDLAAANDDLTGAASTRTADAAA